MLTSRKTPCAFLQLLACSLLLLWKHVTVVMANGDDSPECGMYVAESSIPHAGWGMYTAIPLKRGVSIGPSDVIIQVADYNHHQKTRKKVVGSEATHWTMNEYYWHPRWGGASYEGSEIDTIIPGLGMLANSHTGLVNSENRGSRVQVGPSSRHEPEAGAYSYHTELTFETNQDLPAGMELFVSYGDDWFSDRSHTFGHDLPLSDHFKEADALLATFFREHGRLHEWQSWRDDIEQDEDRSVRTKKALPKDYDDAVYIVRNLKGSTAMNSVPNVVRSQEWLRTNGLCLDHMRLGESNIPHAGKGAFATRHLPKGTIVAPAPVVQLHQGHLDVLTVDEHDSDIVYHRGNQLLLNYVYGHPSTSLRFFPYAPATNLINHGLGDKANVKLRWSSRQSNPEWLNLTTEQLLENNKKTGLMMEFVALRDIQEGEEILVDYGNDWQESWDKHLQDWKSPSNADSYTPASQFNQEDFIKTIDEYPSYPNNVMTVCWFDQLEDPKGSPKDLYRWLETDSVLDEMRFHAHTDETYYCDVLERDNSKNTYTAKIQYNKDGEQVERNVRGIPREAIVVVDRPYTGDAYLRNAFRHYLELPDEMIPTPWRDLEQEEEEAGACQLYMAESSIPFSGLGMYTGVEIKNGRDIFYPDVVVQVEDVSVNNKLRRWHAKNFNSEEPDWLMEMYYWNSETTLAEFEATSIESIVPGLGMLANSHTGLVNAHMQPPHIDRSGLDRRKDPGVGGSSTYHGQFFSAKSNIAAGMELFVGYGDHWFSDRVQELGVIPLSNDFKKADKLLKKFWSTIKGNPDSEFARDLWDLVWYNGTKTESDSRVRLALPKNLSDVKEVVQKGTALNSVPNALRSQEWLKENGVCLDNIRADASTIRQAGKGAFATRKILKGSVITPAPFVHLHRRHMEVYDSDDVDDKSKETRRDGTQLLINYCYGHPKSNLLLFPYSPVTNYVNHHHTEYNAELRWSSLPNLRKDWFERSVEDLMTEDHAGVIMEIVATRDIEKGEEILLDYGKEWEDAWTKHVQEWEPSGSADSYVAAEEFNDVFIPVRTEEELEHDPYPDNVQTTCFVGDLDEEQNPTEGSDGLPQYEWKYTSGMYSMTDDAYRCDVLYRSLDSNLVDNFQPPSDTYTARVYRMDDEEWIVTGIPRTAIHFFDNQYTSDLFLRNGFRHEIGIPDHIFPKAWMDLAE